MALARKVWGRRFQVLVATHMNTDNLHNHFVINSVSYVDGKKYEQRRSQYAEFRAASDKLCREYGLSVLEQPKAKEPARYARMREPSTKPVRMPALRRTSTGRCIGKGIFSALIPTASMQRSGRGMVAVQCGFIGWEKNTIYLP